VVDGRTNLRLRNEGHLIGSLHLYVITRNEFLVRVRFMPVMKAVPLAGRISFSYRICSGGVGV